MFSSRPSVAIIGGGITGLVATYELMERAARVERDLEIRCFEATERAGGNIRTTREDGFLFRLSNSISSCTAFSSAWASATAFASFAGGQPPQQAVPTGPQQETQKQPT